MTRTSCVLFLSLALAFSHAKADADTDALDKVCDDGDLNQVKALIAKGINLDATDDSACTALLHACYSPQGASCALALIQAGANVNMGSKYDRTPLMYAAQKGYADVVAALIAHKANLDANSNGGPAILWAAGDDKLDTVKLLGEAGANLMLGPTPTDPKALTVLGLAASYKDLEMVDFLLSMGAPVDGASARGLTPLMKAAVQNASEVAEHLLDKGAQVDAQDADGNTALMNAQNVAVLKMLLDHRASMDLKNNQGKTALIITAPYENTALAKILIERGADVNIADGQDRTALSYAVDCGNVEIVELLKSKGAHPTQTGVLDKGAPPQTISMAHRWALAVGQIYIQRDAENPQILGGGETVYNNKRMLKNDWGITDKESLNGELDDLRDSGHRAGYQATGAALARQWDIVFYFFLFLDRAHAPTLNAERQSYLKWKDKTGLAWDLCRAARLVNTGFSVGYLNENEAWARLTEIAQKVQANFNSWQEMSDNFLDAREIWANQRDPRFDACAQLLLNSNDPNSPWTQLPWKTDLSGK